MIRRTIGTKLLLGFALLVVLTLALGGYAISQIGAIYSQLSSLSDNEVRVLETLRSVTWEGAVLKEVRGDVLTAALLERAGLPHGDAREIRDRFLALRQAIFARLDELAAAVDRSRRNAVSDERAAQWARLLATAQRLVEGSRGDAVDRAFAAQERGDLEAAVALHREADRERARLDDDLDTVARQLHEIVEDGRMVAERIKNRSRLALILALGAVVVVALFSSIRLSSSITGPLGGFVAIAERVGQGDLKHEVPASADEELATLGRSLNQMVQGLRRMTGEIRQATESLTSAAAEILASVQEQASSTAEQATAVQQTTATVSEISQSGRQVAERAREVAAAAEATSTGSQAGLQAVEEMARLMEGVRDQADTLADNVVDLSEKTQAVGEIIATVNDIAEQSHLLALNAAIEAASAGEHGRSFSVVASEIKSLADQAKEATVQVRGILGDIQKGINTSVMLTEEAVKRVEAGKQQTEVARGTLREMAGSIAQSVQAFQQIVAAAGQQQIGFDQVAQAIQSISQATQQTAVSTRQLEKAAENLTNLGRGLLAAVESYRT
jgi:methyl-accepting chemotaxis protein